VKGLTLPIYSLIALGLLGGGALSLGWFLF